MKRMFALYLVAALLGLIACSTLTAESVQPVSTEKQLIQLEHEWAKAYVTRDVKTLDRIEADDWACTDSEGKITPKAQEHADVGSGTYIATQFTMSDLKVRVYGDSAVVTGRQTEIATQAGKDASAVFQFTDTWVRQDGHWRCVATHLSKVGLPAATVAAEAAIRKEVIATFQGLLAAEERLDGDAVWAYHADVPGYWWADIDGKFYDFAGTKRMWADYYVPLAKLKFTTKQEEVMMLGPDTAYYLWHGAADSVEKNGTVSHVDPWTARYLFRRIGGAWKIVGGQESSQPPQTVLPAVPLTSAATPK